MFTRLMTPEPAEVPALPAEAVTIDTVAETEDFELVLGRRQVASVAFLILVLLAVFSGVSFVAGKATAPKADPTAWANVPEPPPIPILEATVAAPAAPAAAAPGEAPIFANPVPKAIYIQIGAVDKGIAVVLAEGLRKHKLDGFVAPGPDAKTFRVLVGPFRDADGFQKAKATLDQIGLNTFARRYEQQ